MIPLTEASSAHPKRGSPGSGSKSLVSGMSGSSSDCSKSIFYDLTNQVFNFLRLSTHDSNPCLIRSCHWMHPRRSSRTGSSSDLKNLPQADSMCFLVSLILCSHLQRPQSPTQTAAALAAAQKKQQQAAITQMRPQSPFFTPTPQTPPRPPQQLTAPGMMSARPVAGALQSTPQMQVRWHSGSSLTCLLAGL
jgi:hypothetical protein